MSTAWCPSNEQPQRAKESRKGPGDKMPLGCIEVTDMSSKGISGVTSMGFGVLVLWSLRTATFFSNEINGSHILIYKNYPMGFSQNEITWKSSRNLHVKQHL